MNTLGKVLGGMGILIGAYLVLTNPTGTKAATNSLTSGGVSLTKALQGR